MRSVPALIVATGQNTDQWSLNGSTCFSASTRCTPVLSRCVARWIPVREP